MVALHGATTIDGEATWVALHAGRPAGLQLAGAGERGSGGARPVPGRLTDPPQPEPDDTIAREAGADRGRPAQADLPTGLARPADRQYWRP